jgi:hypothetical protein
MLCFAAFWRLLRARHVGLTRTPDLPEFSTAFNRVPSRRWHAMPLVAAPGPRPMPSQGHARASSSRRRRERRRGIQAAATQLQIPAHGPQKLKN